MVVVYDRRGQVRSRQRVQSLPATVGRSPTCDVILDDPQVSALHARLQLDISGRLVLRDAASRNGMRLGRARVTEVVFPVQRAVLLGETRIAVVRLTDAVERTEIRRVSPFDRAGLVIPAMLLAVSAEVAFGWLNADELKVLKLVAEEVLPVVLGLLLWALGWAIASRIAQGRFRFEAHLTVAALALGAARWLAQALIPALGFWTSLSTNVVHTTAELSALAIGAWLLAQHLYRTGPWTLRRCYTVGALLMIAIGLPVELTQLAKADDFDTSLSIPRDALPPPLVLRSASVDNFLSATESLQREVDGLRQKK
jgi:hypothetical protein